MSCAASSRAVSLLEVPGDFSQPASPFGCLDNSAAKHKLGLRHKAGNRRKPVAVRDSHAHTRAPVQPVVSQLQVMWFYGLFCPAEAGDESGGGLGGGGFLPSRGCRGARATEDSRRSAHLL